MSRHIGFLTALGIAVMALVVALSPWGASGPHKTAKLIPKPKPRPSHVISSLPAPEQNLMHFVMRKACGTPLSSVMDTIPAMAVCAEVASTLARYA